MTLKLTPVVVITGLAALAFPAAAQVYRPAPYDDSQGYYAYGRGPAQARASLWTDQRDRPGDYRCDAYWDRGRDDCHEGWRDQRRYVIRRVHHYGYDYQQPAATSYYGAYGRPDLVYPSGGRGAGYASAARDPARMDWCRWTYRSYDPASGYYRAYSGRYVFCG